MTITVTCENCGKQHKVGEAYAGKRGKCTRCGAVMTIPEAAAAAPLPAEEADGYQLEEPTAAAPSTHARRSEMAQSGSTFIPGRESRSSKPSGFDKPPDPLFADLSEFRKALPNVAIAGAALLVAGAILFGALSLLPPVVSNVVGGILAIAGLIVVFYGYATAAYIAFTEDSLYGMLFLLIPIYAGYYFISRWDEMKSRLAIVLTGLVLLVVSGRILESALARSQPAGPEKAGAVMAVPRVLTLADGRVERERRIAHA